MSTNEVAPPRWLFALELAYIGVLVAAAIIYGQSSGLRDLVPAKVGPVPLGVPWWGALGGITISLTGIFRHASDWNPAYNNWHIARPILGAVMGTVGVLVFLTLIRSTGTQINTSADAGRPVYDLIAFLLGYREEVFRDVLRKAVDVLLAPGRSKETGTPDDS
jgi:hypothetical protein